MYKSHSIWDEEEDRHNTDIHKKDKDAPEYHRQAEYNAHGSDQSDVYNSQKAKEEGEKKEVIGIEREVEKETKKYQKKEEISDGQIMAKAASEVHHGISQDDRGKPDKKAHKSIEDAINKAIKEEKEVIRIKD